MVELAWTCCACKAMFRVTPEELICSCLAACRRVNCTSCHKSVGIFLWICEPRRGPGDLYGAVFRAVFAAQHSEEEIAVRDEEGHSSVIQTVYDS